MLNHIVIQGRLCGDPEIRLTEERTKTAGFTVAVDRDRGREAEKKTDFFRVTAWEGLADFAETRLHRGSPVIVSGRMRGRPWTDRSGNRRVFWELAADRLYFCSGGRDSGADTVVLRAEEPDYGGELPF